jgi:hypothetical protein
MQRVCGARREVTMLIAGPTTFSGIFDVDTLPATGLPLNRTRYGRTTSLLPLTQPLRRAD